MEMISGIVLYLIALCWLFISIGILVSSIQSIVNEHKREKREQEKDKRDLEYHEKRMKI